MRAQLQSAKSSARRCFASYRERDRDRDREYLGDLLGDLLGDRL